jgi:hypothetical protein
MENPQFRRLISAAVLANLMTTAIFSLESAAQASTQGEGPAPDAADLQDQSPEIRERARQRWMRPPPDHIDPDGSANGTPVATIRQTCSHLAARWQNVTAAAFASKQPTLLIYVTEARFSDEPDFAFYTECVGFDAETAEPLSFFLPSASIDGTVDRQCGEPTPCAAGNTYLIAPEFRNNELWIFDAERIFNATALIEGACEIEAAVNHPETP